MRWIRHLLCVLLGGVILMGCTGNQTAKNDILSPDTYVAEWQDTREHLLVDVRTPGEFDSGYIEGAINIPVDELSSRLDELPADMPIIVYCRSGNRSARALSTLKSAGYDDAYDLGGVIQWQGAGYSVQMP